MWTKHEVIDIAIFLIEKQIFHLKIMIDSILFSAVFQCNGEVVPGSHESASKITLPGRTYPSYMPETEILANSHEVTADDVRILFIIMNRI